MAFYPEGDLLALLNFHVHHAPAGYRLPEPFLWRAFDALAEAGIAMERGNINLQEAPSAAWEPIIHRDLKPGNVFLNGGTAGEFAAYPTPVLGDFGLAIYSGPNDPFNPKAYLECGTHGYFAPEQRDMYDRGTGYQPAYQPRLTEKTNVWEVAKTIMDLMNLEETDQPRFCITQNEDADFECYFNAHGLRYSKTLRKLVKKCLAYVPDDRPSFVELKRMIGRQTGGPPDGGTGPGAGPGAGPGGGAGENDDDENGNEVDDDQVSVQSDDNDNDVDHAAGMRDFDPNGGAENPHPLHGTTQPYGVRFPLGLILDNPQPFPPPALPLRLP